MPTRPSGSSNRYAPLTSSGSLADGPQGCVGTQSSMTSAFVGVIVARWKMAMPANGRARRQTGRNAFVRPRSLGRRRRGRELEDHAHAEQADRAAALEAIQDGEGTVDDDRGVGGRLGELADLRAGEERRR